MLIAKINCSKIDKTKLFKGKTGTWLDLVIIDTPNSEYGEYMICQGVSKEDREKGIKGAILGNAKHMDRKTPKPIPATVKQPVVAEGEDDVPF
jgi:hypothetical protein